MASGQPNTPPAFADAFRQGIRVGFKWDRFLADNWPVRSARLTTPDGLRQCLLPWYLGGSGREVAYNEPDAKPLRLSSIPQVLDSLKADRQARIQRFVAQFKLATAPVEFSVPAYSLASDGYLVLDGNHRLSALTLSSVPFAISLWSVCGPLEDDCLPDLVHWSKSQSAQPGSPAGARRPGVRSFGIGGFRIIQAFQVEGAKCTLDT
jgi:hypothetical protein